MAYSRGNNPGSQFEGNTPWKGTCWPWNVRRGSIIAELTPDANGNINFRLVGAPSDDAASHSPLRTPMVCTERRWLNSQRRAFHAVMKYRELSLRRKLCTLNGFADLR